MIALVATSPLFSQGSSARILGTITDQTGAAILGATVTIQDTQRGTSRVLSTDAAGAYLAPNLIPGTYTVRAEFKGFKTVARENITLEVGQDIRVDLSMQPGEQTQVVNVTETVPLIETNNAELGGTLQNKVINDLPLNGRNFENLLDLRPGVTKFPGNSGWSQSTNGGRPHDNFFMVDGIDSNDPWMAQSMMNAVMAAGDAGTMLPIDAIDEFKTQQNPGAEYGWKPGAIVNVGIKSGSNAWHGTAYAYGRTDSWDAKDYFADPTQPNPPLDVEQYGASFGGKIIRDKLFFFGNFESQHYSVGNPVQHDVPITNTSSTDPNSLVGACNAALSAGRLSALSASLAGLSTTCAPLSNYPGLFPVNNGSTTALNTALPSVNDIYSGVGKLDYHMNEKNSFSGMYFISPGNGTFVDNPTLQINPNWLTVQYARSQVGSGDWTWVPTSSLVNSLRFGYSHYYQTFATPDANDNPANYSFNGSTYHLYTGQTNPAYFGLPQLWLQGGLSLALGASWPKTVGPNGVWQITDSVSWLRGKHAIKFGGEVLINQSTNNVTANTKGPMRFKGGIASFFTGDMSRAQISSGNFLRHLQDENYGLFIQDDWRVTPRLTLNLGVRYELTTVFNESDNLIGNFDPTQGLVQAGKQIGSVINGDHNNFAPRVGVAWDVFGTGKTVIRAGAGIYYEQSSFDSFMALGNLLGLRTVPTGVNLYTNGNPTPFTAGGNINLGAITLSGGALGNASTPGTIKYNWANNSANVPIYSATPGCGDGSVTLPDGFTPTPCNIMGVDRNLRTPYVTKWSVDIQHAITNDLSLDVAYVGNHATKLFGITDLNQPRLVNGFSPGWGNPADPNSPAGQCVASAATGYDACANGPDPGLEQAAAPFNAKFPYLGIINWLSNNNYSNYNGLQVSLTQRTWHGLSYVAGYTYAHALSISPDNWSFLQPINSNNVKQLYGNSPFDIRHHFTFSTTYAIPGIKSPGQILQGWSINSIINLQTGLPWGINDLSTDFSGTGEINSIPSNGEQWDFFGNPNDFKTTKDWWQNTNGGAGGIPYFAGTSNATCLAKSQAMGALAVASLTNLGCYAVGNSVLVPPAYGSYGNTGPNVFRGFPFYNVDFSITKSWTFGEKLTAQFRAEFFNIFNHPNISNVFGGPGGDNTFTDPTADAGAGFGFRNQTPDVTSSNPVLGSGGPRAIQLGLKIIF
ncbi:MAG TPA: TonB-dependent receptor [Bryobacteraceae bacterium]|nr:TonB-dependent receptor [Bryobacteraceae bacterium]